MLGIDMTNVGYAENYTSTMPAPFVSAGGSVVSLDSGIFCGNRQGVAQILNFRTTPTVQIVAAAITR